MNGRLRELTVGAQVGWAQQLGFSRSWPVYHVILTFSEWPNPRRPFQTLLIVCTKVSAKLGFLDLFDAREGDPASRSGRDELAGSALESGRREGEIEIAVGSQPSLS